MMPVFQPGDSGSIPGTVRNFNFYPGKGVCSLYVCYPLLTLAVALTILLITDLERPALALLSSVLVHSLAPLQASDPRGLGYKSREV